MDNFEPGDQINRMQVNRKKTQQYCTYCCKARLLSSDNHMEDSIYLECTAYSGHPGARQSRMPS